MPSRNASESVFVPEALDANLAGRLSTEQRRELEANPTRSNGRLLALALRRVDPLAKDLREGRVASIEGAVSKRTGSNWENALGSAIANTQFQPVTSYRISVANRQQGDQEFRSGQDLYEFAPDAGMVRLFYLPRSRSAVNLERLPDVPVDISQGGIARSIEDGIAAWKGGDKVGAAEIRAQMAAIDHEMKAYFPDVAALPEHPPERPVQTEAIIGNWTSPFLSLSIAENGVFVTRMPDGSRSEGHWSLDRAGRLHADFMGAPVTADVTVADDELTLILNGHAMRLRRTARE